MPWLATGDVDGNPLTDPAALLWSVVACDTGAADVQGLVEDGYVARQGKRARLVSDFVRTVEELGCRVDPAAVAEELDARINAIAAQLHVTTQTVLRTYIDDDWGRQAAQDLMAELSDREAAVVGGPDELFAVRVIGRLVAALGQAMLYACVNDDHAQPVPQLDARRAAEAISGLGLAIHGVSSGDDLVVVSAQVVAWTRSTLEVFRDQLRAGAWSSCPCGELHGQVDADVAVLRAVNHDLLFLPTVGATQKSPIG